MEVSLSERSEISGGDKVTTKKKISKPEKEAKNIVTSDQVLVFLKEQGKPVPQSAVDLYFGNKRPVLWNTLDKLVRTAKVIKSKGQSEDDEEEGKTSDSLQGKIKGVN